MAVPTTSQQLDPRGLRLGAAVTTVVLAAVLLTESSLLLAAQTVVFAAAAVFGVRSSPYSQVYARLIRPRLAAPTETEDARPPRFAQAVGLAFAVVGLTAFLAGFTTVALIATGFALGAAFLNAAFGFCLGCEIYLLINRTFPGTSRAGAATMEVSA